MSLSASFKICHRLQTNMSVIYLIRLSSRKNFHLAFKSENKEGKNQYFTKKLRTLQKIIILISRIRKLVRRFELSAEVKNNQYRQKSRMPVH